VGFKLILLRAADHQPRCSYFLVRLRMGAEDLLKPGHRAASAVVMGPRVQGNSFLNFVASVFLFAFSSHILNLYIQTRGSSCDQPLGYFMLSAGIFGYSLCLVFVARVLVTFTDSMATCTMPRHEPAKAALPDDMVIHSSFHVKKPAELDVTFNSLLGPCGGSRQKFASDAAPARSARPQTDPQDPFSGHSQRLVDDDHKAFDVDSSNAIVPDKAGKAVRSTSSTEDSSILAPTKVPARGFGRSCGLGLSERSALLTRSTEEQNTHDRACSLPWSTGQLHSSDSDEEDVEDGNSKPLLPVQMYFWNASNRTMAALLSLAVLVAGWLFLGSYWLRESKMCDPAIKDSSMLLIMCGRGFPAVLFLVLLITRKDTPSPTLDNATATTDPTSSLGSSTFPAQGHWAYGQDTSSASLPAPSPFVL